MTVTPIHFTQDFYEEKPTLDTLEEMNQKYNLS